MHGSRETEKMNVSTSSNGEWLDKRDKNMHRRRKPKSSKKDYPANRKMKESGLVWA